MKIELPKCIEQIGLINLGNTCFLNSCMQIFKNIHEFNNIIDNKIKTSQYNKNIPDSKILIEWNSLRKQLCTNGKGSIAPTSFVNNIHKLAKLKKRDLFAKYAQNDMTEFMQFFLESIHNSITRPIHFNIEGNASNSIDLIATECYEMLQTIYKNEYSEILQIFYGIYISQITSIKTKQICSNKPGHFSTIDLPVTFNNKMAITIYDCFDIFTKSEIIDGDNAWFNEKTGKKEDIIKKLTFWNLPPILIITFNRFSIDGFSKINSHINCPLDLLDLSRYVTGYNANQYKYELFGVCNHMGGLNGGHYNSYVRNINNDWALYDDANVTMVKNKNTIITQSAYCLFYRIIKNG